MTAEPAWAARHELRRAVVGSKTLAAEERLVLLVLAEYVNEPDRLELVWISRRRLASETGLSNDRLQRWVAALLDRGALEVVELGRGTRATRYRIDLAAIASGPDSRNASSGPDSRNAKPSRPVASVPARASSVPDSVASGPDSRNRTENVEQKPPAPTADSSLEALLAHDGVTGEDVESIIELAKRDPQTRAPLGRLASSPGFRRRLIDDLRARQRAEAAAARQASPHCEVCGRPVSECDQIANRQPGWCDGPARRRGAMAS